METVLLESVVMTVFAGAAVAGFKSSAWMVVAGLAGHGSWLLTWELPAVSRRVAP